MISIDVAKSNIPCFVFYSIRIGGIDIHIRDINNERSGIVYIKEATYQSGLVPTESSEHTIRVYK